MVSTKSEKTYNYYLNIYRKWCKLHNMCEQQSLVNYKNYLYSNKKSPSYIKNSINTISKLMKLPAVEKKCPEKVKMTVQEIELLKNISKQNYKRDEMSLLLLLILEGKLKLSQILKLTRADVENVISHKKLLDIPDDAIYLFEYLLSVSIQTRREEKYFKKTYHAYLYSFKRRLKELFSNDSANKSFNSLKP